jgi:hypothetical protein
MSDPLNPLERGPTYYVDPDAARRGAVTRIFVRARTGAGEWVTADIGELDRESLHRWLRSRGGANLFAENCVLALLGHESVEE